jgi:hypothetical protein
MIPLAFLLQKFAAQGGTPVANLPLVSSRSFFKSGESYMTNGVIHAGSAP